MSTRVVGNESPGSGAAPVHPSRSRIPAGVEEHVGAEPTAHDLGPQELSSGIAEYCSHFQALADAAPQMMWRFGPDGQCKFFNRPWLEYRGRTLEQEYGAGWTEGVHPEDLQRCTTSYRSAFETRQPFHLEFRVRRADASYAWVLAQAVPQYLLDGSFVGYVGSLQETRHEDSESGHHPHRDGGAPESARQALCQIATSLRESASPVSARGRTTSRKLRKALPVRALLECLDVSITPMVVVDKEGRAVYCNRAFQRFAAKGFLTGKTGAASKVTQWPKIASQLSSVRENSSQVANCTPEVQAWLDSSSTTLEQDCRVYAQRLSVAGDDLTAFSITDTSQEDRIRLLERAFLHDLVNAAGSIQMLIDLLTGGTSRRERDEYIKLLQVSTNRLLSEIYHEKMMLDSTGSIPSGFDAHEILTTLADYYRKQPFARNCRIEIDKGAVESAKLLGDQTLLVRVLDNMLRNAVEAASNGGVITLGYRRVEGEVEFWIHNPHTISENVRTKIFHPSFTMNERDRDGETQETKLLSELCGGTVSVSSDKEMGTTYSIRYPMAGDAVSTHRRFHTKHAS